MTQTAYEKAAHAKDVSIQVWQYLYNHSEVDRKLDLPWELATLVLHCTNMCPICEFFFFELKAKERLTGRACDDCPLKTCDDPSPYKRWAHAKGPEARAAAAKEILALLTAWDIEPYRVNYPSPKGKGLLAS